MILAATAKKLGLSFFAYIRDQITKADSIPLLAELIKQTAKNLKLGWSYSFA